MSNKINLIDKTKVNETKDQKAEKIKKISLFLLILVGFLAISIFLVNYRFSASQITKEQAELLDELAGYNQVVAKMYVLDSRVTNTSKIINNRSMHHETINLLVKDSPSSITIEEFELDDTHMAMVFSANSLEEINTFLNSLLILFAVRKHLPTFISWDCCLKCNTISRTNHLTQQEFVNI